jgi:hypothetical protein
MYAIPAETASQNMPFKKEDLPGPGELSSPLLPRYSEREAIGI